MRMLFAKGATTTCLVLALAAPMAGQSSGNQQQPTTPSPVQQSLTPEQEAVQKEVARQLAEKEKNAWKFSLRPNGGGLSADSPDGNLSFRLLGYAQVVGTAVDKDFVNSFGSGDFRVRRARVGWYLLYQKTYELFVEYDGAPTAGNLVEARVDWWLHGDDMRLRAGKMVVPLSEEGFRSSRNYDTVERFIALNSMFGLPAEDTQFGAMLHGQVLKDNKLTYYLGVWNGNGSAADNARDNNSAKEFQAKASYKFTPAFRASLGVGLTNEEAQPLRLSSLNGTRFAEFNVIGDRHTVDSDFVYEKDRLAIRGEGLNADFPDSNTTLRGGFLQLAYFVKGNYNGGFQPLIRIERAEIERDLAPRNTAINAITAGFNWYINNNVRLQVNAIGENYSRVSDRAVIGDGFKPSLLTELQMRF